MNIRALALALLCALAAVSAASAQEVWFGPQAPGKPGTGLPDWEQLFKPDASSEWAEAAARTNVFSWNIEHVETWPQDQLAAEAAWVHAHGMKLAVTLMPLETGDPCGAGEGYLGLGGDAQQAARMRQAGVLVDIVQMDGPMFFGHYAPTLCQWPVATVAAHVAAGLGAWIAAYPGVEIADIEEAPVLGLHPTFEADYVAFKAQVEHATGRRITHLQFDAAWTNPAINTELPQLAAFAHAQGMRFGVIYDGSGDETTDLAWMKDAQAAIELAEGVLGVIPDDAMIAGWDRHPALALPDSSPTALSWLVRGYGLSRTTLQLSLGRGNLRGRLLDEAAAPIAGAEVLISRLGLDPTKQPPLRVLQAQTPGNAASALLGWRINDECGCAGANDLMLGVLTYAEPTGTRRTGSLSLPLLAAQTRVQIGAENVGTEVLGGTLVAHLQVAANQSFQWNGFSSFPVTPGALFSLSAPIGSVDGSGMFGYATVIFIDANGDGITRDFLEAPDTTEVTGAAPTDAAGDFYVRLPIAAPGAHPAWRASYGGSASERPTEADLTQ